MLQHSLQPAGLGASASLHHLVGARYSSGATLPVRLSCGGCSFQFGRTSMYRPRAPHLAHTTLLVNDGTAVSSGYFDTSISRYFL
jgi:hypothetical protein